MASFLVRSRPPERGIRGEPPARQRVRRSAPGTTTTTAFSRPPVIVPEPPVAGSEGFLAPLPASAAPEDVRHWFDLETILELPAPVASFDDAADAAAQYRRASRAENTRRAYRAAVARFCDWCAIHGRTALPAAPETVAVF